MNQTESSQPDNYYRSTSKVTGRQDSWWIEPALIFLGFTLFIIYATYRALENNWYEVTSAGCNYLSPFYSPKISLSWWKLSPALLILWIPAGFRATCYYYRKAYYRAYFLDPPACTISHWGGNKYTGENSFPLVLQNLHRYFFYFALIVLGFLWWDALQSFNFAGRFGIGVGSIIFLANVILLSGYTLGCHACRHFAGGKLDCFSCSDSAKVKLSIWQAITKLNEHHMLWAWLSLFSVAFTDFYVRLVASGVITDVRLL